MRHAAALLATVTHAANNHTVPAQMPDGTWGSRTVRDAQQPSGHTRKPRKHFRPPAEPAPLPVTPVLKRPSSWRQTGQAKRPRAESALRPCKRRVFCNGVDRPTSPAASGVAAASRLRLQQAVRPGQGSELSCRDQALDNVRPSHASTSAANSSSSGIRDRPGSGGSCNLQPLEALRVMERSGLKVSWPQEAAVNRLAGVVTDRPASVAPCADGPACSLTGLARLDKAACVVAGPAGMDELPSAAACPTRADRVESPSETSQELVEALAELSDLEACGLRVHWPACTDRTRLR